MSLLEKKDPRELITQTTSIRVPTYVIQQVDVLARELGHSRNEVLLNMIKEGVAMYEQRQKESKRR